ncbi:MAG: membrane-targeted effector domain-containing toxin [Opitutae bacterium]|nr:membrane-targeted effector domain-containing toxin [Opitutae bacterium]
MRTRAEKKDPPPESRSAAARSASRESVVQRFPDTPEEEAMVRAQAAAHQIARTAGWDVSAITPKRKIDPDAMRAKIERMQAAIALARSNPIKVNVSSGISSTKSAGYGRPRRLPPLAVSGGQSQPQPGPLEAFFASRRGTTTMDAALRGEVTVNSTGLPSQVDAPGKLREEAQTFMKTQGEASPKVKALGSSPKVTDIYSHHLVVGESHADVSPKRFLVENMKHFRKAGFSTLFMEHLLAKEHSPLLDAYFAHPDAEMPKALAKYLDDLSEGQAGLRDPDPAYNYRTVVEQAKAHGLRVVPIDTALSYKSRDLKSGGSRRQVMNYVGAHVMHDYQQAHMKSGEKWLAFMGDGHARSNKDTIGLAELFGAHDIALHDKADAESHSLALDGKHTHEADNTTTTASFMIHAADKKSLEIPVT